MRNDRLSALAQWGLPIEEALRTETQLGLDSLGLEPTPCRGGPLRLRRRDGAAPWSPPAADPSRMSDVAAFDFDGTLTKGAVSFTSSWPPPAGAGVLRRPGRTGPPAGPRGSGQRTGGRRRQGAAVRAGVGRRSGEHLEDVAAEFAHRHLARRLRPEVKRRFDWHRQPGRSGSSCLRLPRGVRGRQRRGARRRRGRGHPTRRRRRGPSPGATTGPTVEARRSSAGCGMGGGRSRAARAHLGLRQQPRRPADAGGGRRRGQRRAARAARAVYAPFPGLSWHRGAGSTGGSNRPTVEARSLGRSGSGSEVLLLRIQTSTNHPQMGADRR